MNSDMPGDKRKDSGQDGGQDFHKDGRGDFRKATQRQAAWWQTARAVGWSFFGVRRGADWEQDVQKLNPVHVVIAGVLGAALFIAVLIVLVRWVISSGVAAG